MVGGKRKAQEKVESKSKRIRFQDEEEPSIAQQNQAAPAFQLQKHEIDETRKEKRVNERVKVYDSEEDDDVLEGPNVKDVEGEEDLDRQAANENDVPLEPFNLRQEREEGSFDYSGFYIPKSQERDEDADGWDDEYLEWEKEHLENAKKQIKEGKGESIPLPAKSESEEEPEPIDTVLLRQKVCDLLQNGESILQAMRRAKKEKETKIISLLTEYANQLMSSGFLDIYNEPRERIMRKLQNEGHLVGEVTNSTEWWYRWETEGGVYGPFTSVQMAQWAQSGHFQNTAVEVSCQNGSSAPRTWYPVTSVNFYTGEMGAAASSSS
eukprot:GCRY01003268.1.p1 GENE.GCRY01003268.1~~GCRY01003268.1.p1  ORF type:complete len:323 (+),score=53.71 GCRY01003268.1:137-1105(+)